MDIGKFVEEFDKAVAKDRAQKKASETIRLIKKHITNPYVSYEVKMSEANKIADLSMYTTVDDKQIFKMNSPLRYMLSMMAVVRCYTDLEWDKTNATIQFDILESRGFFEILVNEIGPDYDKFQTVLSMVVDDKLTNERSLVSFLETKVEALGTTLNTVLDQIAAMNDAQ